MYNQNLVQLEQVVITGTAVTLGQAPGQVVPARYIMLNPAAPATVTLPLSTPTTPTGTSTGVLYEPGFGPGYPITFINNSTQIITFAAATGDTLVNSSTLNSQYDVVTFVSSPTENKWYNIGLIAGGGVSGEWNITGLSSSSASATLATAGPGDNMIITGASTIFGTASSSGTMQLEKATGTQAVAGGTNFLTATMSLAGTANTVVTGTLVSTASVLLVSPGNRINYILAGTLTSLANCSVTVTYRRV
jgi:hypothetical protein